jgi:hypothetical protein
VCSSAKSIYFLWGGNLTDFLGEDEGFLGIKTDEQDKGEEKGSREKRGEGRRRGRTKRGES